MHMSREEDNLASLIQGFSDFVAEINILLGILQAQIDILGNWYSYLPDSSEQRFIRCGREFQSQIAFRRDHLDSMKQLQEKARNAQALVRTVTFSASRDF